MKARRALLAACLWPCAAFAQQAVQFDTALERIEARAVRLLANVPMLLLAILIVWLAWRIGSWLSRRPFVAARFTQNPFMADLARQVVRLALTMAGVLVGLELLGAMALAGALLGSAGVMGIALGFAFRDLLENYIASVLLSLRQPFAPDDYVRIDVHEGTVVGMNSRATVLMTSDGNHLRLPNALVFKSVTTNFTRNAKRRFSFTLPLAPGSQAQEAMAAGLDAVRETPGVLDEPAPLVHLAEVTRDELRLQFFAWVDQTHDDFLDTRSEALRRARARLKTLGVDFGPPAMRLVTEAAPVQAPARESEHVATAPARDARDAVQAEVRRTRAEMGDSDLLKEHAVRE